MPGLLGRLARNATYRDRHTFVLKRTARRKRLIWIDVNMIRPWRPSSVSIHAWRLSRTIPLTDNRPGTVNVDGPGGLSSRVRVDGRS